LPSPVPLSRLGADPGMRRGGAEGVTPPDRRGFFVFGVCSRLLSGVMLGGMAGGCSDEVELNANGLAGRLERRVTPRGGWGKAPMLIVFRRVLVVPGVASFLMLPMVGIAELE
jgi:hypothetical protein